MAVRKKMPGGLPALSNAARNRMRIGDHFPEAVHAYRIDREQFIIYLGGDPNTDPAEDGGEPGVEYRMADRFDINLNTLGGIDPKRPILVLMSSCGGNWDEGMQMFEAILTCPNPITVLATKWSRSMTSIIPLAADRFLLRPYTKYMYHRGYYATQGTDHEAETNDIERRKSQALMLYIYSTRLREQGIYKDLSEEEIHEILRREMEKKSDVWLDSYEAVRQGFADDIYTGDLKNLRTMKKNPRRDRMLETLRLEIDVEVKVIVKKRG